MGMICYDVSGIETTSGECDGKVLSGAVAVRPRRTNEKETNFKPGEILCDNTCVVKRRFFHLVMTRKVVAKENIKNAEGKSRN